MTSHEEIVDVLVRWAISKTDVRALWLEGSRREEVRRPYANLDVHIGVDEPCFTLLLNKLPSVISDLTGAKMESCVDTPCRAKLLRVTGGGATWTITLERTSMLAKRPRAIVSTLLDRTGHLTHVLDYSLRQETV